MPEDRWMHGKAAVSPRSGANTFAELTWPETWEANGVDKTPIIPSHEFAGVVAEVGPDVDDLVAGDEVFGLVPFDRDRAAAEYVVVPSSSVARKPPTCRTSWQPRQHFPRSRHGRRCVTCGHRMK
jgi:hypothetical protein